MKLRTSSYPGGVAGAGLALLRVSAASTTLFIASGLAPGSATAQIVAIGLAIGFCLGFHTRIVALLALVASLLFIAIMHAAQLAVVDALSTGAVMLTGPGSFSLDARLFGRRTFTLPDSDDSIV